MPTETFSLEILTPTFMGGANPRAGLVASEREGIRLPAVVAGLRWWFRALAGGVLGSEQIPRIQAAESLVFGSTARSSRLRLSIAPPEGGWKARQFVPKENRAVAYLAYGMQGTRQVPTRYYLAEGNPFSLSICISPARLVGEPAISPELIRGLLRLWVCLGGLGGRWRHGLGGLGFRNESPPRSRELSGSVAQELRQASNVLADFLRQAAPLLANLPRQLCSSLEPIFPVIDERALLVKVGPQVFRTPIFALQAIKALWRTHRQRDPNDRESPSRNAQLFKNFSTPIAPIRRVQRYCSRGSDCPFPFSFVTTKRIREV